MSCGNLERSNQCLCCQEFRKIFLFPEILLLLLPKNFSAEYLIGSPLRSLGFPLPEPSGGPSPSSVLGVLAEVKETGLRPERFCSKPLACQHKRRFIALNGSLQGKLSFGHQNHSERRTKSSWNPSDFPIQDLIYNLLTY